MISRSPEKVYPVHWFTVQGTLLLIGTLFFCRTVSAHPAHAKPVNYPFVVGFERFHTDLDRPEHLAKGGLILLNELNCVACHAPPEGLKNQLTGRIGTDLTGVADRFDEIDLEMMIRKPRFVKTDTIMPSMFSGPDRDLNEIKALKHFLGSLKKEPPKYPSGDIDNGRILYHKIGCVACHAPEIDYRPPWVSESIELELTSLPSVPMNLADRYPRETLIDLIRYPKKYRPSGRMPAFDLTEKEAIDIGSYLNSTPKPELPAILQQALASAEPFIPQKEMIEKGRVLFASKNCVACHEGVVEDAKPTPSKPLSLLAVEEVGCLAPRPPGNGVPAYGLDTLQKKALIEALKRIQTTEIQTASEKVDWTFSTRNCYSCHERNHKGGPESAREVFFTVENVDASANGFWATRPPSLEGVGAKLTDDWWGKSMFQHGGKATIRHYMSARMPVFQSEDFAGLWDDLKMIDSLPPLADLPEGDPKNGWKLVGRDGFNCVQCHGIGGRPAPGVVAIDLDRATERLRSDYFHRFINDPPDTLPMPKYEMSDQQISDIWEYLKDVEVFSSPPGLLEPDITELIPVDKPVVIRAALKDLSKDAILVGFPEDRNVAFDIEECRIIGSWSGRFIDPGEQWNEVLVPLGDFKPVSEDVERRQFIGYRVENNRVIVFFEEDGKREELKLK